MTNRPCTTAALGAAAVLAATAQSPAPARAPSAAPHAKPLQFRLQAQNGSGETGTATVLNGTKGLIVHLRMNGGGEVDQPAHIHKGTCDKLDPKPAYPLKTVHDGQSQTTVPDVTLAELQRSPYAINVHKSTKEVAVYVACGNIVAPQ